MLDFKRTKFGEREVKGGEILILITESVNFYYLVSYSDDQKEMYLTNLESFQTHVFSNEIPNTINSFYSLIKTHILKRGILVYSIIALPVENYVIRGEYE